MAKIREPITIRNMELRSRLVMPPMATSKTGENGEIPQELIDYYDAKTANGVQGLVITEHAYVSPEGKAHKGQLSIASDEEIEELSGIVNAIHRNGAKAMAQISHAGIRADAGLTGIPAAGPSAVVFPGPKKYDGLPREMSREEIQKVVQAFADAARRAVKAGYDAVEIHSAHGYLLDQFYSPLTNHRTDEYGGSLENRIRIHREIIAAVREAVGPAVPVALRLGALDHMEGGVRLEDAVRAAVIFEKDGVDLLDISGGLGGYVFPGCAGTEGYFLPETRAVREAVSIPVIGTGGIRSIASAERFLENGDADLIGIGRAILKDAGWLKEEMDQLA